MQKAASHFIRRWREGHLTPDAERNFRVLVFAGLLNLSFALEKLTLVLGYIVPDVFWLIVYGTLALIVFSVAFSDVAEDMEETEKRKNNTL